MKHVLLKMLPVLAIGALVVGCNSEDAALTPGSPDDPEYQVFLATFGNINEFTGAMLANTLSFVDGIPTAEGQSPRAFRPAGIPEEVGEDGVIFSQIWNEEASSWILTLKITDEMDSTEICFEDSVQVIQGDDGPVQYPDPELVTEIRSSMNAAVSSPGLHVAASQNLVLTRVELSEFWIANGSGGVDASFEEEGEGQYCQGDVEFSHSVTNLLVDSSTAGEEELACPASGRVVHSGGADLMCTDGENSANASGSWTVTMEFNDGTIDITVVSGGNIWEATESCL